MNATRILMIADHLERVNPALNLKAWTTNPVGYAADIDEFKELGYRLVPNGDGMSHPIFLNYVGWKAVAELIEGTIYEAQELFAYYYYQDDITAKDFANRLRQRFATKKEKKKTKLKNLHDYINGCEKFNDLSPNFEYWRTNCQQRNWNAMAEDFNVTVNEAKYLFHYDSYHNASWKDIIKRVKELIEEKEGEV